MKLKTGILLILMVAFATSWVVFTRSNTLYTALKIATLDGPRVKKESKPFSDLNKFKQMMHKTIYKDILKEEEKLRQDYADLRVSLDPPSVIDKKKSILDQKKLFLEKKIQMIQVKLQDKMSKRAQFIEECLNKIIKEIVKEKKIQLVINTQINTQIGDKRILFYADQSLDITENVIEKLNKLILPSMDEKEMIK